MRNVAKWIGATVGYTLGAVITARALAKDVGDRGPVGDAGGGAGRSARNLHHAA